MLKWLNLLSGLAFMVILPTMSEAATPLLKLDDIDAALRSGETVNTVMDLGKCTSSADHKRLGAMQGGMRISTFLIRPDQSLSFADDHFTMTSKDRKTIYQLLRYYVKPDNSITFTMTTMMVPEMKQLGGVETYHCKVGEGMLFFKD